MVCWMPVRRAEITITFKRYSGDAMMMMRQDLHDVSSYLSYLWSITNGSVQRLRRELARYPSNGSPRVGGCIVHDACRRSLITARY